MTDISQTESDTISHTLTGQQVLSAVTELCGLDHITAAKLQKGLLRLVSSADWPNEIKRLERIGLTALYHSGYLAGALEIPGDMILLRRGSDTFSLLNFSDQRWQYLDEKGSPLTDDVLSEPEDSIEAIIIKK